MTKSAAFRPSTGQCICGAFNSSSTAGYRSEWLRDWCGSECCWTEETCRSCGRVYAARDGLLLRGGSNRSDSPVSS